MPVPDPRYKRPIPSIKGDIARPIDPPPGCRFASRCPHVAGGLPARSAAAHARNGGRTFRRLSSSGGGGVTRRAYDICVIGGGLVGAALAYGLTRRGADVCMLDEGDIALRASRGNFGLVWVQAKGFGRPEYAQWSLTSAGLWWDLAAELNEKTGLDVGHENRGGILLNLSEEEDKTNRAVLGDIAKHAGNMRYEYEFLDRDELAKYLPGLGPGVVSGSYSPHDGHANPLLLLRALHAAFALGGGTYRPNSGVRAIERREGGYRLTTASGTIDCGRVVIGAGLATETAGGARRSRGAGPAG